MASRKRPVKINLPEGVKMPTSIFGLPKFLMAKFLQPYKFASTVQVKASKLIPLFCVSVVGGICMELFRLHVEVRGQTFFDYIERKYAREKWYGLTAEEKVERLRAHGGKEHLIDGLLDQSWGKNELDSSSPHEV